MVRLDSTELDAGRRIYCICHPLSQILCKRDLFDFFFLEIIP